VTKRRKLRSRFGNPKRAIRAKQSAMRDRKMHRIGYQKFLIGFLLIGLSPQIAFAQIAEISIRAFIPNSIQNNTGYVVSIPKQGGGMQFAIPSPSPLDSDICYLTDQREFSELPNQSSRLTATANIDFSTKGASVSSTANATGTTQAVKCSSGQPVCTAVAPTNLLRFLPPVDEPKLLIIPFDLAASNPCITPNFVAPNIKIRGRLIIGKYSGVVIIEGDASQFPSVEAMVQFRNQSLSLMRGKASGTVFDIATNRPITGTLQLPILQGSRTSTDTGQRFSVKFDVKNYIFTEKNGSGLLHSISGQFALDANGEFIILRTNDATTLRFLGFSEGIIPDILARNPEPSRFVVRNDSTGVSGLWSGILVIKDSQGKFKELKQPSQVPAKTYLLR
jgi:hypothetical protein